MDSRDRDRIEPDIDDLIRKIYKWQRKKERRTIARVAIRKYGIWVWIFFLMLGNLLSRPIFTVLLALTFILGIVYIINRLGK